MRKSKLLALAIAAVMSVSLLAGCGSSGDSTPASGGASGADEVAYKDTITIATGSDQNYMDGQMNNTNDVYLRAVYSQLVCCDANNELVGDLAESWEVSEDGCTWTLSYPMPTPARWPWRPARWTSPPWPPARCPR